jgi:hypothetical protein
LIASKETVQDGGSPDGPSTSAKPEVAKPQTPAAQTPAVDISAMNRKNQQSQAMIHDLQFKLKELRAKLEEEVAMRKQIEAQLEAQVKDT